MTDAQLMEFAEKWRCTHPGCVDWFDMTEVRFVNVARSIEQASRRAALEEIAAYLHGRQMYATTDAVRALSKGETE
ncbi:hypothetical protein [Paraburkholderia xenovorans]